MTSVSITVLFGQERLPQGGQKCDIKLIGSPREGVVEPRRSPEQPYSFCSHDDHVVIF